MRSNFGLICSFSPKMPRIRVGLHCNANEKTNRDKGTFQQFSKVGLCLLSYTCMWHATSLEALTLSFPRPTYRFNSTGLTPDDFTRQRETPWGSKGLTDLSRSLKCGSYFGQSLLKVIYLKNFLLLKPVARFGLNSSKSTPWFYSDHAGIHNALPYTVPQEFINERDNINWLYSL